MKKDLDLVRIVSYIFFDGHLCKYLKCFYLSSKNTKDLNEFEKIINRKLKVKGKYYFNDGGGGITKTHKYRVFSRKICRELEKLGVPKGSKTNKSYLVPEWIMGDKVFSKEFIRIAYLCEGTMKEKRKNPRISINMHKSEEHIDNGIEFMEQLREILEKNGIKTTSIGVYKARERKDRVKVRVLRFRVLTDYNNRFIKAIGWFK